MSLDYPSVLPLDCSKNLFEIIRNRQLMERKEEAAHCLWNIQGYVQGLLLGPGPAHEAGLFGSGTKTTEARRNAAIEDGQLKEIGEELLKLHGELVADPPQFGASPTAGAVNWALWLQMIPTILQMLKDLGIIKTDVPVPGIFGAAPGDFPDAEFVSSGDMSGNLEGHDGKLTRDCSIDELEVSEHVKKALKEAKIKTIGEALDVQKTAEKGLQSITGIGKASEDEFNEAVKSLK